MHFHCTQCPHEFCSGCNNEYHKTADVRRGEGEREREIGKW